MPFYHRMGEIPRKRHIVFRRPDGGLYAEELMGHEGFQGTASLVYHVHPPTTVLSARRLAEAALEADTETSLRHRHFRTAGIQPEGSLTSGRIPILFNDEIAMYYAYPSQLDDYFWRNSESDEVIYVVEGSGVLQSTFGNLPFRSGDYVVIHRNITHRWAPDFATGPARFLVFESRGHVRWPRRYQNNAGQLIEGAPFSERDIRQPVELPVYDEMGEFPIHVKQYGAINELVLDHHPFDVVGWDGCYYPWAFNIHDFEPIVGRIHQPPPVHQTFQGDGFVICSFCPRPYDFDPHSIPAPYHHSNIDSDEVLFYASSEFMSRKGIEYGSITHHPDGLPHGPHPGRAEASIGATHTDELAVMMDSFRPLRVARAIMPYEDHQYFRSWVDQQSGSFNPPTS